MKLNWEDYFKKIDRNQIERVYLFSGPEEFTKERAVDALRKALLPEGMEAMNETVLEGGTAQQIIEAAETLPFLCERRLVIVRDWPPLLPGRARDESDEADRLANWLPGAPESCALVFWMRDQMDGRKKAALALQKLAACVAFDYLSEDKIDKWARDYLKKRSVSCARGAIERLIFFAGRSLTNLSAELDKLASYAGEGGQVSADSVDLLVTPSLECSVFQMMDSLLSRDLKRAIGLLDVMLRGGESRIGVLAMLTRQMRMLTHISLLKKKGMDIREITKALELNAYAASRAEKQAARYSPEALESGYRACVEADFSIKSGKARDASALDRLLFFLGQMK